MITLLEIAERTQTGEKIEDKKWDKSFYETISALVKKYGIAIPREHRYLNIDDDIVERAYEAAIEFLETMGIYCLTTKRRVSLTRQEILTAIREAPTEILMGCERDRRVWKQRKIEGRNSLTSARGIIPRSRRILRGSWFPISPRSPDRLHRGVQLHPCGREGDRGRADGGVCVASPDQLDAGGGQESRPSRSGRRPTIPSTPGRKTSSGSWTLTMA